MLPPSPERRKAERPAPAQPFSPPLSARGGEVSSARGIGKRQGRRGGRRGKAMSFPFHDRYWTDTAHFVEKHRAPEESVLAPDLFWWRFERIFRYANTQLRPAERYDWAILHKGELDHLAPEFLPAIQDEMQPVFANEVFVVWARRPGMPRLAETDPHLAAYFGLAGRAPPAENGAAAPAIDRMLPDRGVIAKFDAMSPRELREAMDAYYRNGGYRYVTLRDKAYFSEIDRCVGQLLPHAAEARILDIACGN